METTNKQQSKFQKVAYPATTNCDNKLACPKCGGCNLSYQEAVVVHQTIDQCDREGTLEITFDVNDGAVSLIGTGRDISDDDCYVAFRYRCPNNCNLSTTHLVMLEGAANQAASLQWVELNILGDRSH